jgi:hypothetical protein
MFRGPGLDSLEAEGYTGYIFPLPGKGPAEDRLSAVQERFRETLERLPPALPD